MSLPRSLRKQSFFVRLSTGEIDLLEGEAIAQALSFGTLDAQTPVCEVGSRVWLPLHLLAASRSGGAEGAALSLAAAPPPVVVGPLPDGPCRVRDRPLPAFTVRRTPLYAAIAGATLVVLFLVGRLDAALADGAHPPAPPKREVPAVLTAHAFVPAAPTAPSEAKALTADQRRRLRARDSRATITGAGELRRQRPQDWARLRAAGLVGAKAPPAAP